MNAEVKKKMVNCMKTPTTMSLYKCTNISFGTIVYHNSPAQRYNLATTDQSVYKKTEAIKKMMESTEPVSPDFLDIVAENCGLQWEEILKTIGVPPMLMEQMIADHFKLDGTKKV